MASRRWTRKLDDQENIIEVDDPVRSKNSESWWCVCTREWIFYVKNRAPQVNRSCSKATTVVFDNQSEALEMVTNRERHLKLAMYSVEPAEGVAGPGDGGFPAELGDVRHLELERE